MKKRVIFILLIVGVAASLLVGCGKEETPKEKLIQGAYKYYETTIEKRYTEMEECFDTNMIFGKGEEIIRSILKDIKISGDEYIDKENGNYIAKGKIATNGMTFFGELYSKPNKVYAKIPIIPQYIKVLDLESDVLLDSKGRGSEEELSFELLEIMINSIDEKNISVDKIEKIQIKGESYDVQPIRIGLSGDEYNRSIENLFSEIIKNPEIMEKFEDEVDKKVSKVSDEKSIKRDTEKLKEDYQEMAKIINNMINFNRLDAVAYMDSDNNILKYEVAFEYSLNSYDGKFEGIPTEDGKRFVVNGKVKYCVKRYDINKPIIFNFPELTEENSMPLKELFQ